ncbi:GGDEF domain-containing protein [Conexibacter woesei]|uniref:GGDEF domain-containing protein n=1 Tax=Conexibacter woesei TaxID=191495 RepID=UPI0004227ADE|nr:GGDEF domain-containing protein [Conexibacter woesei]
MTRARELLAVRAAIGAWVVMGLLWVLYPHLPGADRDHQTILSVAGVLALGWAGTLAVLPANRKLVILFQVGTVGSIALVPVAIAATGGSTSPLRALALLIIVYCAWFYDGKVAASALALVTTLHLLPLAYDPHAFTGQGLAVTIVLTVVFALTGALMVAARRELVAQRATARAEALHDPLTELANRRALYACLERRAQGRRGTDRLGIVLIDLDGFKQVNTIHGHHGGDAALTAAARALRNAARDTDLVARLGGDEFAIVLPDADPAVVHAVAQRAIVAVTAAAEALELQGITLGASAGIAMHPDDASDADALLAAADAALRTAKRAGKGRVVTSAAIQVV